MFRNLKDKLATEKSPAGFVKANEKNKVSFF